jgi:hypothetical protein
MLFKDRDISVYALEQKSESRLRWSLAGVYIDYGSIILTDDVRPCERLVMMSDIGTLWLSIP